MRYIVVAVVMILMTACRGALPLVFSASSASSTDLIGAEDKTPLVQLELVASGLDEPLGVFHAGDGSNRLFVAEKTGKIRVIDENGLREKPFLDFSRVVSTRSEQGLLGLAFEPGRPDRFYVNYTNLKGDTVIARYRVSANPDYGDPRSGEVLLTIDQPALNHNGGHLLFGPDGYLWVGLGDGGSSGDYFKNAQNPYTLLGTILRLDVSGEKGYRVPSDNPYVDGEEGAPSIWATGLRNPWRFSFDRETGDLWLADVGQNQWEEINHVPSDAAGLNFGWPLLEGSHCFEEVICSSDGFVQPVVEYSHEEGCSVIGGYVYRGKRVPAWEGRYFFGDYCNGRIWSVPSDSQVRSTPDLMLDSDLFISAFSEDEAGELYVASFDGRLYRLTQP